jgi:ABC-type antimicrobial peptide transport system permease subunit
MFRNYLVTALRNLRRQKAHSLVNILGLALGMTCTILIMLWVGDELGYDRFHGNFDRLYRVVADWPQNDWRGVNASPMPLGPAIEAGVPEVADTVRLAGQPRKVFRYGDKAFYEDRGILADPSLFTALTFPFVKGSAAGALTKPSDMLLTESTARKLFGDEDPVGRVLEVEGKPAVVTGVVADPPANSTLQFAYVNAFDFVGELTGYATHWGALNFDTFVLLKPNADPEAVGPKITAIAAANKSPHVEAGLSFRLQPLSEVHLDARPYASSTVVLGDRKAVALFSAIAAFVLLIACVNFMNLATARASVRTKEVGLRKTVGAARRQLVAQFLGESFLLTSLAFAAALGGVLLLLPAFNRLTGKAIRLGFAGGGSLAALGAVLLLTGLAAGIYPALVLSGSRPVSMMKRGGKIGGRASRGQVFRRALVVFQFSLAIVLIIMTLVSVKQMRFIRTSDLGFDRRNVVAVPLKGAVASRYESFKTRLLELPGIAAVSAESYPFAEFSNRSAGNWDWEGREGRENLDLVYGGVEADFAETLGLRVVAGRMLSGAVGSDRDAAVVINQSAAAAMGLADPVGKWVSFSRDGKDRRTIVGVIEDPRFRSFHHGVEPMLFYLADMSKAEDRGIVLAKLRGGEGGLPRALAGMSGVWAEFNPHAPFEYTFLDQTYQRLYRKERQALVLFNVFAGLAVAISCLGLFGLASFMAERRTKEVGVRKVLGASERSIVGLMTRDFARWVLAANVVAWPVGYYAAGKLLQGYAYRAGIGIGTFALAGGAALAVAVLTVGRQALKAAHVAPAESLRSE